MGKHGHGYGFIDWEMRFAIPMIYENAEDFNEGKAKVMRGGRWLCINQNGHEINLVPSEIDSKYQDVGFYSEGMCKVSTLKLDLVDLAYHSDYAEIAGTGGFVHEA